MNGNEKNFSLEVEISWSKGTEKHTWKNEATLKCSEKTNFSDIVNFLDEVKEIVSKVKRVYGKFGEDARYNLSFEEYIYSHDNGGGIVKYDRWESCRSGDVHEEGIYFEPDTRYTDEYRSMYIGYDKPLECIIYTLH